MIRFLTDYTVQDSKKTFYKKGQEVQGMSSASEDHFVKRRVAEYVGDDLGLDEADEGDKSPKKTAKK